MSLSRRQFIGSTAAAVIVAGMKAKGTVWGANDRIRMCVAGINGRGSGHVREWISSKNSEVVALCDPDVRVLERQAGVVQNATHKQPLQFEDIREALADDRIDAVSIASPNHWHALSTIWAVQAGKDVYVEKPLSHNVWEGRQLANAAARYGRIVQHGTQSRHDRRWMRDIKLMHDGFIGPIHMAKGFTYKTGNRVPIGFAEPENPPAHLNWNLWQGPAEEQPYNKLYHPYRWHWFWHYGNGETGNQGVHQMDIAVWGLNRGYPRRVYSTGGRYVWKDQAETPNTQVSTFTYDDGAMLIFEVRNIGSYEEAGKTTGNHFLGADGYYVEGKGFFDYKHNPIEVKEEMPESQGTWENFLAAVRSRNQKDILGNAEEGHISSAHCHLGNIAYRLGRSLEFDGATEQFINADDANALLTRQYRDPFVVPEIEGQPA
jgi:predicted dehydrogenase